MTPGELEKFLLLCQKYNVQQLKLEDVVVVMSPPSMAPIGEPNGGLPEPTDEDYEFAHTGLRPRKKEE